MSNKNLKYYIIAAIIFITVLTVIIFIFSKKTTPTSTSSQIPPILIAPTTNYELRTTPSVVPIPNFTGADPAQTLPPEIQNMGEQKTALRRLTPLSLDFGVIEFDYENDTFLMQPFEPKEESRSEFSVWKTQNYPALTDAQFNID